MNLYDYLQSYQPYFWKWADKGDVLEAADGSTLAYTGLVKEILSGLYVQGIPALGTLLLVLVATNDNTFQSLDRIEKGIRADLTQLQGQNVINSEMLSDAFSFLQTLSELKGTYGTGERRAMLLQAIFQRSHNSIVPKKAKKIVASFSSNYIDAQLLLKTRPLSASVVAKDLKPLAILNRRFPDKKSLLENIAAIQEPDFDEEIFPNSTLSQVPSVHFIEELANHPKTFELGRLIKPLWAGLNIPAGVNAFGSNEYSGVADISAKGDFDKLLVSELANEDLILLSRLANNEALYLHKEMPPATDDKKLFLLADISLQSWGTPKILAHACMIAIAKHPKLKKATQSFVVGEAYQELSFQDVNAVIDGLRYADATVNPATGLSLFLKDYGGNSTNTEVCLIITPESFYQPDIQNVLSNYYDHFSTIITIEQNAQISIYKLLRHKRRLIQQFVLDTEKHWEDSVKQKSKKKDKSNKYNFPILVATPINVKYIWGKGAKYLVADNCLFFCKHPKECGYKVMLDGIEQGGVYAMGKSKLNQDVYFLTFNKQNRKLAICNLSSGNKASVFFPQWKSSQPVEFFFFDHPSYPVGFYHIQKTAHYRFVLEEEDIHVDDHTWIGLAELQSLVEEQKQTKEEQRASVSHKSILRNVRSVSINGEENLMFNTHELICEANSVKLLDGGSTLKSILTSEYKNGLHVFPDGSTVSVHKSGVFILQSSNALLPLIYIPSVLKTTIAMATDNSFAGNEYYNPRSRDEMLYNVVLSDTGPHMLEIIRILKEDVVTDLVTAKQIAESKYENIIINNAQRNVALKALNKLTKHGAKARLECVERLSAETITVTQFAEKYLKPFIANIIRHAAKSNS